MVEMRTCSSCGHTKNLRYSFHRNGRDKEGNPAYRADCKDCYTIVRGLKKKHKISKFVAHTKSRTGEVAVYCLKDWRDALLHFRGCCAYCGVKQNRKLKLTKEHVVPVSKGGLTVRRNIIPACMSCNSSKTDHDLDEWFPRQKTYSVARWELIQRWRLS